MTTPVSIKITCELADESGLVALELRGVDAAKLVRIARNIVEQAAAALGQQAQAIEEEPSAATLVVQELDFPPGRKAGT